MILDLNKSVAYCDCEGNLQTGRQRKRNLIIDGVVGGEKQNPSFPTAKVANLLLGSNDSLGLDTVTTYLVGFDPTRIPLMRNAWKLTDHRISNRWPQNIEVVFNGTSKTTLTEVDKFLLRHHEFVALFEPSIGWKDHIEWMRMQEMPST